MNTAFKTLLWLSISLTALACVDDMAKAPANDAPMDLEPDPSPGQEPVVDPMDECEDGDVLDAVLGSSMVRGTLELSVDGQPSMERPEWGRFAQIMAIDKNNDLRQQFGVDAQGRFEFELGHGTYDLVITFTNPECPGPGCPSFMLEEDVVLDGDMTFEKSLELVSVSGVISLDSQAIPNGDDATNRGFVWFHNQETNQGFRDTLTGEGAFRTLLPRNTGFDAYWVTAQRSIAPSNAPLSAIPLGAADLGRVDTGEGAEGLTLDARSIVIESPVTVDGAPLQDDGILDGEPRGKVLFQTSGIPYASFELSLGEVGPVVARFRVFPGRYGVNLLSGRQGTQDAVRPSAYIGACGAPDTQCEWLDAAPDQLDFILPTPLEDFAPVSGTVDFVDGEGQPVVLDEACPNPSIIFINPETGRYAGVRALEDGRFEGDVQMGTHEIWIQTGWGAGCPVGAGRLSGPQTITNASRDMALTATVVTVNGEVFANGTRMTDDGLLDEEPRGVVELIPTDFPATIYTEGVSLGETGPATFEMLAYAGNYRARLRTMTPYGRASFRPTSQDVLPATFKDLGPIVVEGTAVTQDFDVFVTTVRGTVSGDTTYGSELFPETHTRGLRFLDAEGAAIWVPLEEGLGEFEVRLYEGRHQLTYGTEVWGYITLPDFVAGDGLMCD